MEIEIQNHKIGDGHPVFFIAEAGVNHNGSLELAFQLVDKAFESGADAVKFQTFKAEKLNTKQAPKSSYHIKTTGDDKKQSWFELLKTQELDREDHQKIIEHCNQKGIIFLSTPYDEDSADLLDELGVPAFKLASTDTNNLPLLRHVARKKKPLILSSAMCTMDEVITAVETIRSEKLEEIVVLQCTGNYPSKLENSNLNVMSSYREILNCLVGYSDHTFELINPVAAVALGASVYEKHFTVDKSLPGPDHPMSLSPDELKKTIDAIKQTKAALGSRNKAVLPSEEENRIKLRKSLVSAVSIARGTIITAEMICIKRPGNGISPTKLEDYIGKKTLIDVTEETVLQDSMFK
jgi:N,N'-diacetyllegionaminate synthase